jgi:hypothetical protein
VEITQEEEAQLHTLSDAELAAVFAIVEAAEAAKCTCQDGGAIRLEDQNEKAGMLGPYTIVQQLRTRLRQLYPVLNSESKADPRDSKQY